MKILFFWVATVLTNIIITHTQAYYGHIYSLVEMCHENINTKNKAGIIFVVATFVPTFLDLLTNTQHSEKLMVSHFSFFLRIIYALFK